MDEQKSPQEPIVRPIGGDLIIPLMGLFFTIYYFSTIWNLKWEAKLNGFIMGSTLIFLVLIFLARSALAFQKKNVTLGLGPLLYPVSVQKTRAALLLLSIVFIVLIPWLGFTLSIVMFMAAALWLLRVRSRRLLIGLPLLLAGSGYILFIVLLDSRLPHGPFELIMNWIF